MSDIAVGINSLGIRDNAFDRQRLDRINIFNILDEILIANFFRVAASAIFSTKEVSKFLIFDQTQVIEDSDELISSD